MTLGGYCQNLEYLSCEHIIGGLVSEVAPPASQLLATLASIDNAHTDKPSSPNWRK